MCNWVIALGLAVGKAAGGLITRKSGTANVPAVEANLAVEQLRVYSNIRPVQNDAQPVKPADLNRFLMGWQTAS